MRWKVQSLVAAAAVTYAVGTASASVAQNPPGAEVEAPQPPAPDEPERHWAVRPVPSISDIPDMVWAYGSYGEAVVACTALGDGRLVECRAESEKPEGYGIGRAAVRVARRGRLVAPVSPTPEGTWPTIRTVIRFHTGR